MRAALAFVISVLIASVTFAQSDTEEAPVETILPLLLQPEIDDLEAFRWVNRILLVFANVEQDPRFLEQIRLLEAEPADLAERDVRIVLDANPSAKNPLREQFHPNGFMLVLVGKDGQVYLRKPLPWDVRELSRSIDKMPLRQQEVRDRR